MAKRKFLWSILVLLIIFFSCKDDQDKYARPEWLAGKVYSQIEDVDELSEFAKCIKIVGYDSVINVSGSYTVFAPTNDAIKQYLQKNNYSSVDDIPRAKLLEIVKYHIVQNPWSRDQLRSLDVNGWIDPEDEENDEPRGFKRQTLLLRDNFKCGVKVLDQEKKMLMIIDSSTTTWNRRVITDSRKFAPIFYAEYFGIYNLQLSDYAFYFDRQFENADDMYYVDAKLLGQEIFAENGFIHRIDRVVEPLLNANEILTSTTDDYDYSKFLNLVNQFPSLNWNSDKTYDQEGADLGLAVDSLFDLTYPELTFNINSEKTKAISGGAGLPSDVTIRFHHGLIAPTNEAFDKFVNQYIVGFNQWGSLEKVPYKIQKIIANTYFSGNPIYESDIANGFYNGEGDILRLDRSTVVQKQFGSNCTFIGVNEPVVPRAFKSVTGPVYRQTGYSTVMNAIEFSGLLSALKREGKNYGLFVVPDSRLKFDSTLLFYPKMRANDYEEFRAYQRAKQGNRAFFLSANDIRLLLLNQVTVDLPTGSANKEFLQTLAGNYIVWDNRTGLVRGTTSSTDGHNGSGDRVDISPFKISEDTDNGNTYNVDAWFSFSTVTLYNTIASEFKEFHSLLVKAGLADESRYVYKFISSSQLYTVFAPTPEALQAANASALEGEELVRFLKMHFVVGDLIFTDGKKPAGYYETTYSVAATSNSPAHNLAIYITPGTDKISIAGSNGGNYLTVNESEKTNIVSSRNLNASNATTNYKNIATTGVIHSIDKALIFNQIDVK
ncbi:MAG TPA: fasciclin domain-containing protein [Prolixibacteraceae bacterium]|nr:fasciclin domain-containing protein [Prolixibacteraceae bacterium]